jgi:hypothetical protein
LRLPKYPTVTDDEHLAYEFLSQGSKGTIKKVVLYQQIEENIYNLAFGDWDEIKQTINDRMRSNNDDRDMVLVTVASTVIDFLKYHPNSMIFAQGSTTSRTRLYQIEIIANLAEITNLFEVFGNFEGNWEPLERNKNYRAFLLSPKE